MNINIDNNSNDKRYIDTTNIISAKDAEILSINIDNNNNNQYVIIAKLLGLLLELKELELDIFINMFLWKNINNEEYHNKSYVISKLATDCNCSIRTIYRGLDKLINKQIILINPFTNSIRLNPKYSNVSNIKNIKTIAIIVNK